MIGKIDNLGRQTSIIGGITGVSVAGGTGLANFQVNCRYHRLTFFTTTTASAAAEVTDILDAVRLVVNGVVIQDIAPLDFIKSAIAQGYIPKLGELPIFFSEPLLGALDLEPPDQNSWDMAGQQTFQVQLVIKSSATNPGVTGIAEYDFKRNLAPDGKPFLQPISKHSLIYPVAVGVTSITAGTIPISFPIRRMWLQGSTASQLTQVELLQDNNQVILAPVPQLNANLRQYGFKMSADDYKPYVPSLTAGDQTLTFPQNTALEAVAFYDTGLVFDVDGRYWKALQVANSLNLRVTSAAAMNLTIVIETLPGAFIG